MFDSTASPAPSLMWLSPLLNGMKLLSAAGWSKIHKIMLGSLLLGRVRIVYSQIWKHHLMYSPRHVKLFSFQYVSNTARFQ